MASECQTTTTTDHALLRRGWLSVAGWVMGPACVHNASINSFMFLGVSCKVDSVVAKRVKP
jgi:hypothetical protein